MVVDKIQGKYVCGHVVGHMRSVVMCLSYCGQLVGAICGSCVGQKGNVVVSLVKTPRFGPYDWSCGKRLRGVFSVVVL